MLRIGIRMKRICCITCMTNMVINGHLLPKDFLEGFFYYYKRSDNCVKNHFYSKLRRALRKVNKICQELFQKDYK